MSQPSGRVVFLFAELQVLSIVPLSTEQHISSLNLAAETVKDGPALTPPPSPSFPYAGERKNERGAGRGPEEKMKSTKQTITRQQQNHRANIQ